VLVVPVPFRVFCRFICTLWPRFGHRLYLYVDQVRFSARSNLFPETWPISPDICNIVSLHMTIRPWSIQIFLFFFLNKGRVQDPVLRLLKLFAPSFSWSRHITSSYRMIKMCLPWQTFRGRSFLMVWPFPLVVFVFCRIFRLWSHSYCFTL
jgi:hypothetical protein